MGKNGRKKKGDDDRTSQSTGNAKMGKRTRARLAQKRAEAGKAAKKATRLEKKKYEEAAGKRLQKSK